MALVRLVHSLRLVSLHGALIEMTGMGMKAVSTPLLASEVSVVRSVSSYSEPTCHYVGLKTRKLTRLYI